MKKLAQENAKEALKKVIDPELGIDIWTLGLIYNMEIKKNKIQIKMTFTSPMCPYGPVLVENVKNELKNISFNPEVEIVFTPPWQPSEEIKMMLGLA
ncbi:DUF59 domain-containing protein [Candidatus Pacearchaeota archaeon]|nr:DUF59 domain-containing protein [Candidatus Pacearchaeota archaeon]